MDKNNNNKNRTDLIAAGRKKLQQFRQKKDGKGGKASGKPGKSGRGSDSGSSDAAATTEQSEKIVGKERSVEDKGGAVALSDSDPQKDSLVAADDVDTAGQSSRDGVGELVSALSTGEESLVEEDISRRSSHEDHVEVLAPLESGGDSDVREDIELRDSQTADIVKPEEKVSAPLHSEAASDLHENVELRDSETAGIVNPEDKVSAPLDSGGASDLREDVVLRDSETSDIVNPKEKALALLDSGGASDGHGDVELHDLETTDIVNPDEKVSVSNELVPVDTSSQGERGGEEQVTDEAGSSCPRQNDITSEIRRLGSDVGSTVDVKEVPNEDVVFNHSADGSSVAMIGNMEAVPESGANTAASEPLLQSDQMHVARAELVEIDDPYCSSSKGAQADRNIKNDDVEGSHVYENDGVPKSLGSNMLKVPFGPNPFSMSLSQLAEIIKGLDKDEFRFLYSSRESPFVESESSCLERVKEQLYLTSFAKEANELQLNEQLELEMQSRGQIQKLMNDTSVTGIALSEAQANNELLSDQLAECRSELNMSSLGNEDLLKQLQGSKAELEDFSVKVDDLQNRLEVSGEELAKLVSELVDERNSLSALRVENESLCERLSMLMEEKMTLVDTKEYLVQENEKMAAELGQFKASSSSMLSENISLTEHLTSVTEENIKLGQEKECLVTENVKLLSDLTDRSNMVQALREEISELSGLLVAAEEDKKKLEMAQANFVLENEKLAVDFVNTQSSINALQMEMSNLNGSLSSLMEERNKLEDEKQYLLEKNENELLELARLQADFIKATRRLQDASLIIEQLTQENVFLKINLELYMAQISNSEDTGGLLEGSGGLKLANRHSSSLIPSAKVSGNAILVAQKTSSSNATDVPLPDKLTLGDSSDPFGIEFWKTHLNEANELLQGLENDVDHMQSLSASLSRSSGKQVAPAVSKLIQAFETKSPVDGDATAELHLSGNRPLVDPFIQAKEQTQKLQVVFARMLQQTDNLCIFLEEERKNRLSTEGLNAELNACCNFWETRGNDLETENIELVILCEALKHHISHSEESVRKLLVSFNDLQSHEVTLDAENSLLKVQLRNFQEKVAEFLSCLNDICRSSEQMVSSIPDTVVVHHEEVADTGAVLNADWKAFVSQIMDEVRRLDFSIETVFSLILSSNMEKICHVGSIVAACVDVATKVIVSLQGQLHLAQRDHHSVLSKCTDLNKEFSDLQGNNEVLASILDSTYRKLRSIVDSGGHVEGTESAVENEKLVYSSDPDVFDHLLEKLQDRLDEKSQILSVNDKLNSDITDKVREIDGLKQRCFDLDVILKLFKNVGEEFKLDAGDVNPMDPLSGVESFIDKLTQKYKEATEQVRLSRGNSATNELQFDSLHGELDNVSMLLVQYENDNFVLKESLRTAIKDIAVLQAELLEKVGEFEQSELRVSSLREKLGTAVSKGKGLIVHRESLKQSLAETCNQLDSCSQELQLKDARINELEAKLTTYSEAGERMEALKSELAYIRNSATALRESFLLKDSVLQRIEEILEDLELPEHFHSGDIIEKVQWLAKSISGNVSVSDWDQKSSFPESGFTGMDGWKEEAQPNQDSVDDFRRRYEDLQGKFYGLAEHNDMLEQSLMERNNLVQRWEEVLGKIEVPSQLSSLEPEDKIQWLGCALLDSQNECQSLQKKIDSLDTLCGSLTGDLEESRIRISELESAYHSVITEKENLVKNLGTLTTDCGELSKKASLLETENDNMLKEIASLQKVLDEKLVDEEHAHHVDDNVRRFCDQIRDALQDPVSDGPDFAPDNVETLEHLLGELIGKCRTLLMVGHVSSNAVEEKTRDGGDAEDVVAIGKKLEDTLGELAYLKEERDRYFNENQSLVHEVEALCAKKSELQELLNHEEQKSASWREKLHTAVKKGKSLVQQKDNMKKLMDDVNAEVGRLKSDLTARENAIADYEQKVVNLSTSFERIKLTEAECASLGDTLSDTERHLEEKERMLSLIEDYFKTFEVDFGFGSGNLLEKLEAFGKNYQDLREALYSSEQESRKSKRAAELLLAELNEVQERNDALQEDLYKVGSELSELSREKEMYEAENSKALAHLEKLASARLEERDSLFSEVSILRSSVDQLQLGISAVDSSLTDVLSTDLEILHNLDASIKSCLEPTQTLNAATLPTSDAFSHTLENKVSKSEVSSHKERLQRHYLSLNEEANHIFETVRAVCTEVVSLKEAIGSKDRELMQLKSTLNDKDSELLLMQRNLSLLFEACNVSIAEIENWKAQQSEISFPNEAPDASSNSESILGKDASILGAHPRSVEDIMALRERLLSVFKDLITKKNTVVESSQKEMKALILNLQKEVHEKDIQRERICSELVGQIKEAEAEAVAHLEELQSAKSQASDLQVRLSANEEEHSNLAKRIKELEYREAMCVELQRKVSSLTDVLAAKDQEIEALMQALDEEESQMEGLSNKILELEADLQKKKQDLEKVEASRGKALKKLSVTVGKFDELHNLSETLLSEVEKLQSQLQERNEEISFLRQEVTRCTNETLSATQMSNRKNSDEVLEVLNLLDTMVSQVQVPDISFSDADTNQVEDYKVKLQKKISFILSELEKLQALVLDRDILLGVERSKVEDLTRKEQFLEKSLVDKESQLTMLRRLADSGQATSSSSEIVEADPLINKRGAVGTVAPQVRGGRKTNSDHVAIAIDMDQTSPIEDEDDDKSHGFKSLTTSRIVPRFTRPVSDMFDGLWMSCDRALMRQPTLRLGVIIYWAIIHTLLAAFVV